MKNDAQSDFLLVQEIKKQKAEYERKKEEMTTWKFGLGPIKTKKEKNDLPS